VTAKIAGENDLFADEIDSSFHLNSGTETAKRFAVSVCLMKRHLEWNVECHEAGPGSCCGLTVSMFRLISFSD